MPSISGGVVSYSEVVRDSKKEIQEAIWGRGAITVEWLNLLQRSASPRNR